MKKYLNDRSLGFLRAARSGNLELILQYVKQGVDVNVANANGLTALHLASKEGFANIVRQLIKLGAQVNAKTKKGNTALHIASLAGNFEIVKILISNHADINAQTKVGFTPLYMAAQEGHYEIVEYFLDHKADPNLATDDGYTPLAIATQQGHDKIVSLLLNKETNADRLPALHMAAKHDDVKSASLLLKNNPNPDVTSKNHFTALHIAAHYGNVRIAKLLLEKGANVDFAAQQNITPLHVASKCGRLQMVHLLCSFGAEIDCRSKDQLTPLHYASRSGRDLIVRFLLTKGQHLIKLDFLVGDSGTAASVKAQTKSGLTPLHVATQGDHVDCARILIDYHAPIDHLSTNLLTPLHVAAHCGSVRTAKVLLERGVDINAKTSNGFTPLHIACKKNRIKIVEILVKYGALANVSTKCGLTPLHVAAFAGNHHIVYYLIQNKANIEACTQLAETALHFAVTSDRPEVVKVLLRHGARVNTKDKEFQTPLHIACKLGNLQIVQILVSHGANVNVKTYDAWTPLHIAAKEGHVDLAEMLLRKGAQVNAETKRGYTALHLAVKYGYIDIVKTLIQIGGLHVASSGNKQPTPLHTATKYDHQNIILYLLEKGLSPRTVDMNGRTPLHIAAKKNNLTIASALLQYGSDPNARSRYGFTPLHFASKHGHTDMVSMLLQYNADPNIRADNGSTPLHLCAQEDRVQTAHILKAYRANINAITQTGYTPLHMACHFARMNMVRFLLRYGAEIDSTTFAGYTPLHLAIQKGSQQIVDILLHSGAYTNFITSNGQKTPVIGRYRDHVTELDKWSYVTNAKVNGILEKGIDDIPEIMQETDESMSESGGESSGLSDDLLTKDKRPTLEQVGGGQRPNDGLVQINGEKKKMDPSDQVQLEKIIEREQQRSASTAASFLAHEQTRRMTGSPATLADATEISNMNESMDYQLNGHYLPDNIDISAGSAHGGFLISFLVDARGGAMRGCRHSGVRIIIPPRKAPMPMRITCRYLRKEKLVHPPALSEGEALASRILEMGPAGAKFLGPVILEIPHFASLRNREREVIVIRSDDGEHWKEHQLEATEDAVQEVLNESFDPEELSQLDDLHTTRITRILTNDFPQYFAVVTRIRQEVHAVGPEGGMIGSTVVPTVKAIFPEGALTKTIKVSLQAQPIAQELVTKLHGSQVAVSPIVTVEPRRRKFHKPITLCIPLPQTTHKSIFAQQQLQNTALHVPNGDSDTEQKEPPPTLRLLCSITGGTSPAKWEDITGTTQLAFSTEHVSFTTTVSARFWLMDCQTPKEAARMAQEIYNETVLIPYMAKFVVFARRTLPNEWQLRVFCMTDDREDKTLERQEHYTEIAKSRDVEVTRHQYLEFSGNIVPVLKSGEHLNLRFVPFQENRLMFTIKKKEPDLTDGPTLGRISFLKEPKTRTEHGGHHQLHPMCTLALALPDTINYLAVDNASAGSHSSSLSRKYRFSKTHVSEMLADSDISIQDIARDLGADVWEHLGRALNVSDDDLRYVQREYYGQETLTVLRVWIERDGSRATKEKLEMALRQLGRDDVVKKRSARASLWNERRAIDKSESVDSDGLSNIPTITEETESKKLKK